MLKIFCNPTSYKYYYLFLSIQKRKCKEQTNFFQLKQVANITIHSFQSKTKYEVDKNLLSNPKVAVNTNYILFQSKMKSKDHQNSQLQRTRTNIKAAKYYLLPILHKYAENVKFSPHPQTYYKHEYLYSPKVKSINNNVHTGQK